MFLKKIIKNIKPYILRFFILLETTTICNQLLKFNWLFFRSFHSILHILIVLSLLSREQNVQINGPSKVVSRFYTKAALGSRYDAQNSERQCLVVRALYEAENRITNSRRTRTREKEGNRERERERF